MNDIVFSPQAFKDYLEWLTIDKSKFKKINDLIRDIQRNGLTKGLGKPEPLKHIKGYSRQIDHENRLVYSSNEKHNLDIISCKGHYI